MTSATRMPLRHLLKRFLPYYGKYKKEIALDLFCALMTTGCEIVFPQIVRMITNQAVADYTQITTSWVLTLGGVYLLLRIIDTAANHFMQYWGHVTGAKLETDMRTDLFNHLQQLSFSYYNETKVGQIMARITSDLFDVTEFSHHCPEEFLIAGVKITASFIILCGMNVWLTLMVFLLLPFMLIGTRYFRQKMRIAFKDARHQVGEINAQVEDSLLGVRVVKSFANEDLEIEKFGHGNDKFYGLKKMQYRYMAGFNTVTRMFEGTMYILVVVAGALFLKDGKLAVGDYTAFLLYISTLLTSIRRIVDFSEQFERGMTGIERFCEIMDAPVEIKDKPGAKPIGDVKGEVRFEKVGFHYADDVNHEVLGSVDMLVHAGQNVALVGPSGAGKTTLCNLIPPVLRCDQRPHPHRRQGYSIPHPQISAQRHRHGAAGGLSFLRHRAGKHFLRQAGGHGGRNHFGRQAGRGTRVRGKAAGRVRYLHRRAGREALRRPKAAPCHRPGVFEKPAHFDFGRGHQRPG